MRAKKSLGQNFLRDDGVIGRIISSLRLTGSETVIEIGPGQGALTTTLLERANRVIAIEFDRDMVAFLERRFEGTPRLQLLQADALNVDYSAILPAGPPVKLVANLPYNVSTPILQSVAAQRHHFSDIVLMFQREVVERITAKAGGKERGYLSVIVEEAFETENLFDVAPTAFVPVPKVWSAVVRLIPKSPADVDHKLFRRLVSIGFAQKRKTILNNLRPVVEGAAERLSAAGIDPIRRAETLTLDEWLDLTRAVSAYSPGSGN